MTEIELLRIVKTDGSLCNARHWGDVESIVNHVNGHYQASPPVTAEQVRAALAAMRVH